MTIMMVMMRLIFSFYLLMESDTILHLHITLNSSPPRIIFTYAYPIKAITTLTIYHFDFFAPFVIHTNTYAIGTQHRIPLQLLYCCCHYMSFNILCMMLFQFRFGSIWYVVLCCAVCVHISILCKCLQKSFYF